MGDIQLHFKNRSKSPLRFAQQITEHFDIGGRHANKKIAASLLLFDENILQYISVEFGFGIKVRREIC